MLNHCNSPVFVIRWVLKSRIILFKTETVLETEDWNLDKKFRVDLLSRILKYDKFRRHFGKFIKKTANKQKLIHANFRVGLFSQIQFVTFNPRKVPWNWIAFSQNSFVISRGLSYHLIRRDTGPYALDDLQILLSNLVISSKQ